MVVSSLICYMNQPHTHSHTYIRKEVDAFNDGVINTIFLLPSCTLDTGVCEDH